MADSVVLGASHLASDGYEVQRTNNFEISVSGIGELTGNVTDTDTVTLAIESAFLPSEASNDVELHYGNALVHVAGTTEYGTGKQIVVKDIISASSDIESIIVAWRKAVYDPDTDKVGLAFNYKKEGRIVQYAPDGTMERTWKLKGVFPLSVDFGNLQYDSRGAIKTISITLSYDKAIRQ